MYTLSTAIMHAPQRTIHPRLLEELPSAHIITGSGTGLSDVWPTAKRCWIAYDDHVTHHAVFQDDLLPCLHLIPTILKIIRYKPDACIGLYHNKINADQIARERSTNWIITDGPAAAPALILPVTHIKSFLWWEKHHVQPDYPHDDGRLCLWAWKTKCIECYFTTPTLVEHIAPNSSTIGQNNKNKVSGWFIGEDTSGMLIDWNTGLDHPVYSSIGIPGKRTKEAYIP